LHVLDWDDRLLLVPVDAEIDKATLLANGRNIAFEQTDNGYLLQLPEDMPDEPVTVIRLDLDSD
jgi:hypothetical protein